MKSIFLLVSASYMFIVPSLASFLPRGNSTLEKRVTHTGEATWFDVGLGACGEMNVNADHILALSTSRFGSGGNCDQWVEITEPSTGVVEYGLTRDECTGCGEDDLDLSPSLFKLFAPLSVGVIQPISWQFKARGFTPP